MRKTFQSWDGESVVVSWCEPAEAWVFIARHSTVLGPATGGTRLKTYGSPAEALTDAQRLARGMTYKWAGARICLGGGKGVIAMPPDPGPQQRNQALDHYARVLKSMRGAFRTGADLGTTPEDIRRIRRGSGQVVGMREGHPDDPGPFTAVGVFAGIKAALRHRFGDDSPSGRRVLIQGAGGVGRPLAALLAEAGAEILVSDLSPGAAEAVRETCGGQIVSPERMWDAEIDVYAPCAVGATVNPDTIPSLKCAIVAGSANNQLLADSDADSLLGRGILYAPDFMINAGGAIAFTAVARGERDPDLLNAKVAEIGQSLQEIFEEAASKGETPLKAAMNRAEAFLASGGKAWPASGASVR